MANVVALNNVYNHYLTTYSKKSSSPQDTHKKSELRNVYNSIVKLNKESPLYLGNESDSAKAFAISIKEDARLFSNTINSLSNNTDDSLLNSKTAYSTDSNVASATYIGNDGEPPTFQIYVEKLASSQKNMSTYLDGSNKVSLKPDTYSFDIGIHEYNYEFQFSINEGDTNKDLVGRLNRLINNANIGIVSSIDEDAAGNVALSLESTMTGLKDNQTAIFSISDNHTSKQAGVVDYLNINHIISPASNAEFYINDNKQSSKSNEFMVENMYIVQLNSLAEFPEQAVTIGAKDDLSSLTNNVTSLVEAYNQFIQSASSYQNDNPKSNFLVREMKAITNAFHDPLANFGISPTEDGSLSIDEEILNQNISSETKDELLDTMQQFASRSLKNANNVSLNPMNYVDRTIVAYKNPGKNFATPYITSSYSGMMFNSYC